MRAWTSSWRWITLVLVAWAMLLFYLGGHMIRDSQPERSSRELSRILTKLERLKLQNQDLRRMAHKIRVPMEVQEDTQRLRLLEDHLIRAKEQINSYRNLPETGPGRQQEELRRKVEKGVQELWWFLRSEVKKLTHLDHTMLAKHTKTLLQDLGHQQRSIMTDLLYLGRADGAAEWREQEAKALTELVQNRISYLQNPVDCSTARKLVCNINKGCGFGCQLHHATYCFLLAYGTKRTLVLESQGWRYAPGGWSSVFLPVSNTCTDRSGDSTGPWAGEENDRDVQVMELPIIDSLQPRPAYLPLAIPLDLAPRLTRLHGDPSVWWVGQFVSYLVRPQPWLQKDILSKKVQRGFTHPIIGVHVRRTDKVGSEAAFHPLEEYMKHVEERFQLLARQQHLDSKRVYLATDDPTLLKEAREKYPDYQFISDNSISISAGLPHRYSETSLRGVILDIYFLSRSDFLVCTFSSQVCRVAYEMMQSLHPDASSLFVSLDDVYYFGGQNSHLQEALYAHTPRSPDDLALLPGDLVAVAGNHWDGNSKGVHQRSGKTGLYPSYKVREKVETVNYPTYPEVDKLLTLQHTNSLMD